MPSRSDPGLRPPRRRLSPEARRAELLTAAIAQLREHGTECTVEQITTAAGTAKGNFYRYFPSWTALLDAARDHVMADYRVGLVERFGRAESVDWWELLDDEIRGYIDFQLALGPLHDLLFHRADAGPPADGDAPELIAALLDRGVAAGAFRVVDTDATARILFHAVHGAADEIAAGAPRKRIEAAVGELVRRTLGG